MIIIIRHHHSSSCVFVGDANAAATATKTPNPRGSEGPCRRFPSREAVAKQNGDQLIRHRPVFQGGIWNRNHQGRPGERPDREREEDKGITNLPRRHLEPKPPRSTSERPDGKRRRTEASLIFQGGIWNRNHQGRLVRGRDKEEDGDGRV